MNHIDILMQTISKYFNENPEPLREEERDHNALIELGLKQTQYGMRSKEFKHIELVHIEKLFKHYLKGGRWLLGTPPEELAESLMQDECRDLLYPYL